MYLLSQLWLHLVLACLAGVAFGFALRFLCSRRAQDARRQVQRDEAEQVQRAHVGEMAALRDSHAQALATRQAEIAASQAQATDLQERSDRLTQDQREAMERIGLLGQELESHRSRSQRLAEELADTQAHAGALQAELSAARESRQAREAALALHLGERDEARREVAAAAQRQEQDQARWRSELDEAQAAWAREREGAIAAAASATAAAGAAALAHRRAVSALESQVAHSDAKANEALAQRAAIEADLAGRRQELAARSAALQAAQEEGSRAAAALARERDELRDQLQAALLRMRDEADAARRAHSLALTEQREAHASAWAQSEARAAEQAQQQLALQAQLEAAQASLQKQAGELDVLHTTLAANDEQLAVLAARAQAERERKEACESILASARDSLVHQEGESRQRLGDLSAEVERLRALADRAPIAAPVVEAAPARAPVSALALLSKEEMARQVLDAGAGQPPRGLAAGQGEPDDLKTIDGIGPVNEGWLHRQGVWYFWRIAAWLAPEVAWVARHLPNFGSRVYRENWVAQAAKLAAQGDAAANAATD